MTMPYYGKYTSWLDSTFACFLLFFSFFQAFIQIYPEMQCDMRGVGL